MKWYWFQTYVLWPTSIIFYIIIYFMFYKVGILSIPFDTNYHISIVKYLIPLNIFLGLLLIYFFHNKKSLSIKIIITSHIILIIVSYLFFNIPMDIFYIIPCVIFTLIKEKKFSSIKSKPKPVTRSSGFVLLNIFHN